jgi:thymidylate kinase
LPGVTGSGATASTADTDQRPLPTRPGLLERLAAGLDGAGIVWAVLHEGAGPRVDDVTLLVPARTVAAVTQTLHRCGFAPTRRADGVARHIAPGDTGRWLRVGVVTGLRFGPGGGVEARGADWCLRRRRRDGPVWRLDPRDAFWVGAVRALVDGGPLPGHIPAEPAGAPLLAELRPLLPRGLDPADVVLLLRSGAAGRLRAQRPGVLRRALRRDPVRLLRGTGVALAERTAARVRPGRRGMSVALLGPDGVGKSTVAAGAVAAYPLPSRHLYMGMWQGDDRPGRSRAAQAGAIVARPLRAGWRATVAAAHVARGRLVVFDRYTYDALLPITGSRRSLKRPYFWLLAHSAPRPDLVLVLDLPGETAFARKGESTPEELEAVRQGFLALVPRLGADVVDASAPPEQVRAEVVARIWRRHREFLAGR